jgi:hypothetical protein
MNLKILILPARKHVAIVCDSDANNCRASLCRSKSYESYNFYQLVDTGVSEVRAPAELGVMGILHEHQAATREVLGVPLAIPRYSS